ncbi:MAG: hypothetical protein JNL67_11820 [Planctomycetaceae bacterium]|nr:hypothetical protein [Planctomycetaceae bacterium]
MSHDSQDSASIFRYSVTVNPAESNGYQAMPPKADSNANEQTILLLRVMQQVLETQKKQVELLEEVNRNLQAGQRQRVAELQQWKNANPQLAGSCWRAAQALGQVQADYLRTMTDEVDFNAEDMMSSEYVLNEFVDRFGPRMAHLNTILQVLGQLGTPPAQPKQPK